MHSSRRDFLAAALASAAPGCLAAATPEIGLSIGNYGMKSLSPAEALRLCAGIGYDGMELCLMPGWPTEPKALAPAARAEIRRQAGDLHLALPSMLEHLSLVATGEQHTANLERIKLAGELGHAVSPARPPMIQTILGGTPKQWDAEKDRMLERLGGWARAGRAAKTVVAVKSHILTAVDTPEKLLWLLGQVDSPWVRGIYDYGHFYLLGLDLMTTLEQLLPHSVLVTVKDSAGDLAHPRWLLPGEGKVDYAAYFSKLKALRYRGFILVEVSTTIHSRPGYDPVETTKRCYANLLPALVKCGMRKA